ncbi:hypothetical protein ACGF07_32050, partial [Kitasatospora sp. NPDC048194]
EEPAPVVTTEVVAEAELDEDQDQPELTQEPAELTAEMAVEVAEAVAELTIEDELDEPEATTEVEPSALQAELAVDGAEAELQEDQAVEEPAPVVTTEVVAEAELDEDQDQPELTQEPAEVAVEVAEAVAELTVEEDLDEPEVTTEVPQQAAVETAAAERDTQQDQPEPADEESWQHLPYAMLSDAELSAALAYAVDAAETAQDQAAAQEARAAELAAALAPGGEIEQRVAARAERVEAIQEMRAAAVQVEELTAGIEYDQRQAAGIEARLAETGRFGRPAVRGPEREQLERQLLDLRAAAGRRDQELAAARQQLQDSTQRAGSPAEHEEVLANWQRAGGSREAVLARTTASRERGLQAARAEADAARGRVTELDTSAATIRQEMQRRDAQPYAQRLAEEARRIQAAQRAAEQQRQQNQQQQGPDQNRGGRGRNGPEL